MNNHGKSNIAFIIGVLLLFGFVVAMLEMNNVINIRALFGGEGHFIPIDYEKEVVKLCDKADSDGNYNNDLFTKMDEKSKDMRQSYSEKKDFDLDDAIDEYWKELRGKQYCKNHICAYFEDSEETNIYACDCSKKEVKKGNFKESYMNDMAEFMLMQACSLIDSKGELKGINNISCEKFYCTVYFGDKPYSKSCNRRDK